MKIQKKIIGELLDHAKKESPIEACGYLACRDGVIAALYRLKNIDRSNEHFSFDPREQFAALKEARAAALKICAVYHSHPKSPARPSREDMRLAYDPDMLYVIVSLDEAGEDVKAFWIKRWKVEPVELEVIADEGV